MNDLEICRTIADIEQVSYFETRYTDRDNFIALISSNDFTGTPPELIGDYNPLTDDALCFQLMVKYDIRVESFEPTLKDGSDGYEYHCYKQGDLNYAYNTLSIDKSPNKAICLAIIEAHKEQS